MTYCKLGIYLCDLCLINQISRCESRISSTTLHSNVEQIICKCSLIRTPLVCGFYFLRTLRECTHTTALAHIVIRSKPALEKLSTLDFHTDTDIILY